MTYSSKAAQQYKSMGTQSAIEYADSHQLITMLYEGAMERIAAAKGAMLNKDVSAKGTLISKAITIVDALRAYLDMEKGGEISQNLRALYDYMEGRLFEANIENDDKMLDEVFNLLSDIRSGWVEIAPNKVTNQSVRQESSGFSIQG